MGTGCHFKHRQFPVRFGYPEQLLQCLHSIGKVTNSERYHGAVEFMVAKGQFVIPTPDKMYGLINNPVTEDVDHGLGGIYCHNLDGITGLNGYFGEVPCSTPQIQDK